MISNDENTLPVEEKDFAYDFNYEDEYAFWEDVVYNIPTLTHNIWPKINQGMNTISKSACTIFWAWGQLIRLFALDLTREEANKVWLEIIDYCVKKGWYVIGKGRGTPTAINYVCKWRNETWYKKFWKEKVFYLRVLWSSPIVREALDKWHMCWYTKTIQWAWDQISWYVSKNAEDYTIMVWHRLNLKGPQTIEKATWWATRGKAQWACQDNYFEQIGTNFFIEDLGKYINKGVYAYVYLILPESSMHTDTEAEKERIAETKAINAIISALTSTWGSVPEWVQEKSAEFAKQLREEYEDAMPIIGDDTIKNATSVVNQLSFSYKFVPEKYQAKFAELAKELRGDFNIK